jgi:probable H4MPT-linked C1 transfer pathway protein
MTAELSDVYSAKREGVNHILNLVEDAFREANIYVLRADGELTSVIEARDNPIRVASANWAATGWLASQLFEECIVIDVGSTTTSIIPISQGKIAATGNTDLEKLICGELVYTGALRTNLATITDTVLLNGDRVRVSSELFASTGDVHLVLGNLRPEDYTVETPDGRGKSKEEALARIARLVCADTEMLGEDKILEIARYVEERQILQIAGGLEQVLKLRGLSSADLTVVVTGLGRNFLARRAAERLGLTNIVDLGRLVGDDVAVVSTAFAVALLTASKFIGGRVEWLGRF